MERTFSAFLYLLCVLPSFHFKRIPIGGIFHNTHSYNSQLFYKIVSENEFEPIIDNVSEFDSFKAGKIACSMAMKGVAAIFGPQVPPSTHIVKSICSILEIPHIQTNWDPNPNFSTSNAVINIYPDALLLSQTFADLIKDVKWKSFTILYENDSGLIRLQEVLKMHGPDDTPITIRQLSPDGDHREILKAVQKMSESHIILDCETSNILDILHQAKEVKLMEDYQSYILTSLDAHTIDFSEFKDSLANITALKLIQLENIPKELTENTSVRYENLLTETALMYDATQLFMESVTKLYEEKGEIGERLPVKSLACNRSEVSPSGRKIIDTIKQTTMQGITGPIFIDKNGRRTNFVMDTLELSRGNFKKTGTWDSTKKPDRRINYTRSQEEINKEIELNIQQKVFIVTSREGMPFLRIKEGEDLSGNDRYEGYSVDLIDSISKILNFKYEFRLVDDKQYGSYNAKTKKWNGLIGQLLERGADLAICDLTITSTRRKVVDFTMPFMTLGISILYTKPANEPPALFSFMAPLSAEVWIYMAVAFIGVVFSIYIIARMNPGDWENPHPCNEEPTELENIWNIHNCVWLTMGSLMAQGCDILPKGVATRMAIGMWWFFALIILSSYTANLAAFLTLVRMEDSIESAEDLVTQSKIKYGAVEGGSTLSFFKETNISLYQRMYSAMESSKHNVFAKNNDEGVERVLNEKRSYAFIMESTSIEYAVEKYCDLTQIGGLLDSKGYGIAMPINSPYRTSISGAVLKLQESGKLEQLKSKWWKPSNNSSCRSSSSSDDRDTPELGMNNVGGVFVVLGAGCGLAFFVGFLEFLWNVRKVAVCNKIRPCEAFMIELRFAFNFFNTKKPIEDSHWSSSMPPSSRNTEMQSISTDILKRSDTFSQFDIVENK